MKQKKPSKTFLSKELLRGLSPKETVVLDRLARLGGETPRNKKIVASKLKCSYRCINFHCKSIRDKGINTKFFNLPISETTQEVLGKSYYRLHGEAFRIKLIKPISQKYFKRIKECNRWIFEGNTILLHKSSIEIIMTNKSHDSKDRQKCEFKSINYLNKIIRKIENRYDLILIKQGKENTKRYLQHYAKVNDGIAIEIVDNWNQLIRIYSRDDGKCWLHFDKSKGLAERENAHPQTAPDDTYICDKYLNDWREHPESLTNSELSKMVSNLMNIQTQTQIQLKLVVEELQVSSKQLQTLTESINALIPREPKKAEIKQEDFNPQEFGIA